MATPPGVPHDEQDYAAPRERREHPRARLTLTALSSLCGGLLVVILFFAAIGAVDFGEAVGLSVAAVVFATVWFFGFWTRHNRPDESRIQWRDRERRGF